MKRKPTNLLEKDLAHLREELRDLRFRVSQNQHKDVRDVREKRKDIARIMSELNTRKTNN